MPTSEEAMRAEADYALKFPAGQLIAKQAWNDAIKAAAELMEKQTDFPGSGDEWEHSVAAIRKLKKP